MKSKLLIWILCFFSLGNLKVLASTDYGLHFKSHSVPGNERTSLSLDGNSPFHVEKEFIIDFQMWVRNEPDFGAILHLCTNENQFLHFVFAAGDNNRNFPALVFNEGMFAINTNIEKGKWVPVSLHLNIKENQIDLKYDSRDTTMVVPLRGTKDITVSFGKSPYFSADVVPMNIRDIKITRDGELIRYWKLWKHNGDVCLDEVEGAVALASYPSWLIDNHIEWRKIYTEKTSGRLDVAFNARDALFYLVRQNKIEILNGISGNQNEVSIVEGYPAMEYTDHMVYDTLTNQLLSYSLHEKLVSALSVDEGKWSLNERHLDEPRYYNHARTFNPSDSSFYFLGGYGFYQYRNNLYRLKVGMQQVEEVAYTPVISPRYSSAAAIVGDELYIFGGRGNKQGKQEFNAHFYYELCAINLKTGKSRSVWKKKQATDVLLMASSMYFEPSDSSFYSEVCWFGLEHMNLGYHDFNRLPNLTDGIFAGKPYEEGKPGYQYERIPPYVTTFNPGLDPQLPLYKALPMFNALKAALKGEAWAPYKEVKHPVKPELPQPVYRVAYLVGTPQLELADFITKAGITLTDKPQKANLWIMDAETVTAEDLQKVQAVLKKWQKKGGMLLALSSGNGLSGAFCDWLPEDVKLTDRRASALEVNKNTSWGSHFELPDLYFSEMDGDRYILKHGLTGNLIEKGEAIFSASRTDWNLFNNVAEHWKCAQVVLYETLNKPEGVALVTYPLGNVNLALSVIDYHLWTKETSTFWKNLFRVMAIDVDRTNLQNQNVKRKEHDLLMDGPTD